MEEGPEPQELYEQGEHHEHAAEHAAGAKKGHLRAAVTAAIMAVLAALGSLLSGHAANEAILMQSKASDQWAYYQAKSTKAQMYEVSKLLLKSFDEIRAQGNANSAGGNSKLLADIDAKFQAKASGYEAEKKSIEERARYLEEESTHEFEKHQLYSFAIACFQIGIVLASVSILVSNIALYSGSIISGVIGIVLLVFGWVK